MDLESYSARYAGETRLQRLLLVARTTTDETLAAQAFDMAEQQIRQDGNAKRYKEIFGYQNQQQQQQQQSSENGQEGAASMEPLRQPMRVPSKAFDQEWVIATETSNRNARHILQGRLSTAQSHLHKEAIRTAYISLAHHDGKTGELRDALGSLLRATDYCTSRSQTAQISLLILEYSFAMEQYPQVRNYVAKVERTLGTSMTPTASSSTATAAAGGTSPSNNNSNNINNNASHSQSNQNLQDVSIKLKIASGLERLAQGEYALAATIFTQLCMTTSSAHMEWPGVTSAEDIALYASLLSLATQDRNKILELAEHPEALELVPAMKDLLLQWSRANYVKCMEAFSESPENRDSSMTTFPPGDLYLSGSRRQNLSRQVREKCLMEYLRPYQCVQLDSMAQLFPSISNLEDTLVDLMSRGLIPNAKIDARANVLYKKKPKPTVDLTRMEQRVMDDTHAMLIRLACLEFDLCVQDTTPRGGMGGGGDGGGALYDDASSDDEGDTPMLDADAHNSAVNPEDLY